MKTPFFSVNNIHNHRVAASEIDLGFGPDQRDSAFVNRSPIPMEELPLINSSQLRWDFHDFLKKILHKFSPSDRPVF
jgi:hypothetical protein